MKTFFTRYAWLLGVGCLGLFLLWQVALLFFTPVPWRFKPGPPVPLQSTIAWPRYGSCDWAPCARITQFETSLSARELQDFYGRELAWRGWHHHCTATVDRAPCLLTGRNPSEAAPGAALPSLRCNEHAERPVCEVYNHTTADRILVFDRGRAGSPSRSVVEILVGLPEHGGQRIVRIVEVPGVPPQQPALASELSESVGARLIGDWEGREDTGVSLLLRFYQQRTVLVARGGTLWSGVYALNGGATKLRLQFPRVDPSEQDIGCKRYPIFLRDACRSPQGIDLHLALHLDGDRLALTQADGRTLTLNRQGE